MDFGFLKVLSLKDYKRKRISGQGNEITAKAEQTVKKILADIKERGEEAVVEYASRYDVCKPESFSQIRVGSQKIKHAYKYIRDKYPDLVDAIELCIENINYYHREQLKNEGGSWFVSPREGKKIGQLVNPLERVGIYVPGGRYPYPSSLLMGAIPAKIAGVPEIAVCSPQQSEGEASKVFLYACCRLNIEEVYNLGGAQAIGLIAYGAGGVKKVDKIVGPGNIYVTAAKKEVFGVTGIDSLAGPSEIVIIADESAREDFVAADLISQAEHDPDASVILLSKSRRLAEKVVDCLKKQIKSLHIKYEQNAHTAYQSLKNNCSIVFGPEMAGLVKVSNQIAPEHLEIIARKPDQVLKMVKNAGAIFVGNYTPVALGDYIGGTNHVIPTAGNARFASPLGVYDFLKKSSVLSYDRETLARERKYVEQFSAFENLHGHRRSITIRFGDKKDED